MSLIDFYSGRADKKESGINGLEAEFADRLYEMLLNLPPELAGKVTIYSAYRDVEHQRELWERKLKENGGDVAKTRQTVAPPGKSNHNGGLAVDLKYATNGARKWVHANAARFGLNFPMSHEDWHIEPTGVRSGEYRSSGHTHGESPNQPPMSYAGADPEAYTDDQGLIEMNNNSLETQLLRVADTVTGGRSGVRNMRTINAKAMADMNSGRLQVEEPK